MKILLDMNLPPSWVGFLRQEGFDAVHWSGVGDPRAPDAVIMAWARERDVVRVLRLRAAEIEQGAVVSIDKVTSRVRVLPIRR